MRAGVLIIGSLLWDEHETRVRWRARLDVEAKTPVEVPIRYGRLSSTRGNCYSMTFAREGVERLGTAWAIPVRREIGGIGELIVEANELARAEGMAGPCTSWGVVAALERERGAVLGPEVSTWRQAIGGASPNLQRLSKTAAVDANAVLRTAWPKFGVSERSVSFDALLAIVTQPDAFMPTARDIARAIVADSSGKGREYFARNRTAGITTFQDDEILRELENQD